MTGFVSAGTFSEIPDTGLLHRYDARALSLSDGQSVTTWPDLSGTDNLTEGKAPTYQESVLIGNPIVRFNGTDTVLLNDWSDISQPVHVYWVFTNYSDVGDYFFDGASSNSFRFRGVGSNGWEIATTSKIQDGTQDPDAHIATLVFDGSSSEIRIDGTQLVSGDVGTGAMTGLTLGTRGDLDGGEHSNFDAGEGLVYDPTASGYSIANVESYLSDGWGITI